MTVDLGGRLFLVADDGGHGEERWVLCSGNIAVADSVAPGEDLAGGLGHVLSDGTGGATATITVTVTNVSTKGRATVPPSTGEPGVRP